ncbi:hypothetical protein K8353_50000, partial [Burkholderia contaminans]|nr:hypothetical protein [Burkholderia contaminans]
GFGVCEFVDLGETWKNRPEQYVVPATSYLLTSKYIFLGVTQDFIKRNKKCRLLIFLKIIREMEELWKEKPGTLSSEKFG